MLTATRHPIPAIVHQHLEDAAALRSTRSVLVRAPHVRLHLLGRLDERLAAHLDGLAVAGEFARGLCLAALESPGPGTLFTATVGAIEHRDSALLDKLLAIAEATPDAQAGLVSAFGWVPTGSLRGITKALLDSPSTFHRGVGLSVCAMHQVNPGASLDTALNEPALTALASAVAGKLGRRDLLPACLPALASTDDAGRFHAARAALLLGERDAATAVLRALSLAPGPYRAAALCAWLQVATPADAHALLKTLAGDPAAVRLLVRGAGVSGDVHYVPWLIRQMDRPALARLAGESLSLITGLDLADLDLDRSAPELADAGPNDDPDDTDVALDEDESLPWPDPGKLAAWWQAQGSRFTPGTRYFLGEPPSPAHCLSVLKSGFQRQRIAAAHYLSLLQPGTPLFNTAAPASRQQGLLARMAD